MRKVTKDTISLNDEGIQDDARINGGSNNRFYYYRDGNLTLNSSVVGKRETGGETGGETRIVYAKGTVTIAGNLVYSGSDYQNLHEVPTLIIYAKNIKIGCGVTRIDGVLLAGTGNDDGIIVTCGDKISDGNLNVTRLSRLKQEVGATINNKDNSHPLTINGSIVADILIPNRTYGAGPGANSMVPAEIINFDPTLYRFGGQRIEGDAVDIDLDVTYSRELAPRL